MQDIFYLILSFSVLWVAAILGWFLWHIAMVAKRLDDFLQDARGSLTRAEQALTGMKGRFDNGTTHLGNIVEYLRKKL